MQRRQFLKTLAAGAAAGLAEPVLAVDAAMVPAAPAAGDDAHVVVAVRNGDPVSMFRKGIAELGGMAAFVKAGQTVVVKPNIAWDRPPVFGANTNPELVGEIVRQCKAAGAAKVVVFDHTCNEWTACYAHSGIRAAAEAAGAEVQPANLESQYVERKAPAAGKMKTALVFKALVDADVFIDVPVLKNHGGAKLTAALKNLMGVVWDRGFLHRHNLPQCIADLALYRKPDLCVVDAYRVMFQHGPLGTSPDDTRVLKYQLLSRDPVAVDLMAAKLLRYTARNVPYLALAAKAGLGFVDEKKFTVRRVEA